MDSVSHVQSSDASCFAYHQGQLRGRGFMLVLFLREGLLSLFSQERSLGGFSSTEVLRRSLCQMDPGWGLPCTACV